MAGWDLKCGIINEYNVSEDCLWFLFNYVFSDSGRKRNIYEVGLIKDLLGNEFNGHRMKGGVFYTYKELV